ncbi:MAG: DUF3943 domain-containing protein [Ichthyobacteriaceae bacterium]|nr:DUF3943 domain-containing protein [Ichthyobacteriaceae bacterium]
MIFFSFTLFGQNISYSSTSFSNTLKPNTIGLNVATFNKDIISYNYSVQNDSVFVNENIYDPVKDPRRLIYSSSLLLGSTLLMLVTVSLLPSKVTNWKKTDSFSETISIAEWKGNVREGPVVDNDLLFFNWVAHPWSGAVYYMIARGSGYNRFTSFAYSAVVSTLIWEYGIEAFKEVPSWQDLFVTPILGSIIGEGFFIWKGNIIRNDKKILNSRFLGGTILALIDPIGGLIEVMGYETKMKSTSVITPIGVDAVSGNVIWGMQMNVSF